ncbi:TIGR02757 family protein [Pedobacter endophyticus]|uniref:TIGR02757 family protein n=1 Tax=Pedobacter endophyticus TaxID=2789740 RepID=A0A7S9PZY6_9SPHI|nr:TIGR02757 family protein [Pedobacter endophyticus]QPH40147.1 TIGR02757 family protein [Pedobacter endophyticus]
MQFLELKNFLDSKVAQYNQPGFIANDPVCIPHLFTKKQDIEISGFLAAVLAWGQRKTIISKCRDLLNRMDNAPFDFVLNHTDHDLKGLLDFKHRTFNDTDLLYFIAFFKAHYAKYHSLEDAFIPQENIYQPGYLDSASLASEGSPASGVCFESELHFTLEQSLNHFRSYFFSLDDYPHRTKKHISSPLQKSTCKRLNMFLRWMVRQDNNGVDFGLWKTIKPDSLICPCDVHVDRVGRLLGLIKRKQTDWTTAVELTQSLKQFDAGDPVKYDFALFGLGVEGIL